MPDDFGTVPLSVSDCVAVINQALEYAVPSLTVEGEVANFRVSRGKWVYFDINDETAVLRCFAVVHALGMPLEDGMVVRVHGAPRLHPLYNFSLTVRVVTPVGEGALRRAADLLRRKLEVEGLFDATRKRALPAVPRHIALLTAADSAAYSDFVKVTKSRWGGVLLDHYDVQVQGEAAVSQIVDAITAAGSRPDLPDVLVLTRGGGSAEDMAVFNDERVVRAVAGSRIPTLVAIGHEKDISLAEAAADIRASTPSNAAELLFPDRHSEIQHLVHLSRSLDAALSAVVSGKKQQVVQYVQQLRAAVLHAAVVARQALQTNELLLGALDPRRPLEQGYALVRRPDGGVLRHAMGLKQPAILEIELQDGYITAEATSIRLKKEERTNGKK